MRIRIFSIVGIGLSIALPVRAGVVEFTDKDAWISAVGPFTSIDFTEYPSGTVITDQYAELGVLFTDGNDNIVCCDENYLPNDGAGLSGSLSIFGEPFIHLSFPVPQRWLAVDFPEGIQLELYSEGQLLHTLLEYGTGDPGLFVGVLSSQPFDAAVIGPPGFQQFYDIDDLHFGAENPCPADLDGDGAVGIGDFLMVLGSWGGPNGDTNGDGTTDILDFLVVLGNWGPCP